MQRFINWLTRSLRSEEAATAVEYAVMVALIAVVVIVGATALGVNSNKSFCDTAKVIGSGSATGC